MTSSKTNSPSVLILGIGNILMGDEGIGVHVIDSLGPVDLPAGVECLDGGVGSFLLLDPMQSADEVILIDATIDGSAPGTIRKLQPRYSKDYPTTLTAHDIGLKDMLDAFYMMGRTPRVTLFAVSIAPLQDMVLGLSSELQAVVPKIVEMVAAEAAALTA